MRIDAPDERVLAPFVAGETGDLIHRSDLEAWQARHEQLRTPMDAGKRNGLLGAQPEG